MTGAVGRREGEPFGKNPCLAAPVPNGTTWETVAMGEEAQTPR